MKTHFLFLFLFLVTVQAVFGQKEANVWFFGIQTQWGRALDFNTDPVTILDTNSFRTHGSNAVICDSSGNLLFVSNGETVFDKNLGILPGSIGLLGSKSCYQGTIFLKKPNSDSLYYLFTTYFANGYTSPGYVYWHLLDKTLNNGLGDFVIKNQPLFVQTSHKLLVIPHQETNSFWVITTIFQTHNFRAALLDSTGFVTVVQSNLQQFCDTRCTVRVDLLKYHPGLKKIASACEAGGFFLFDFDNQSGIVSTPFYIHLSSYPNTFNFNTGAAGLEFSLSGRYLFVANSKSDSIQTGSQLLRYDLQDPSFPLGTSKALIYQGNWGMMRNLQMGPDGRIYICSPNNGITLGVISNPDSLICRLDTFYSHPTNSFIFTLPNIYTGYLYPPCAPPAVSICPVPAACAGDTVTLCVSGSGSVLWSPNYNLQDATTATTLAWPETTTVYTVTLTLGNGCTATDSVTVVVDRFSVSACPVPPICAGDTAWLCASGDGSYLWSPNYNLANAANGGTWAWPETTTVYTVTLTLGNGCTATDSVTVIVHQNSPPTFEDTIIRKGHPFGEFFPTADTLIRYHYLNQYGCDSTVYWEVRIDTLNSVNSYQLTVNSVEVFPNPVRGELYVKHTNQNAAFRLYNKLGQVVLEQQNLPPGTAAVSLRGLAEGVYFWEYALPESGERVFGKTVKVSDY